MPPDARLKAHDVYHQLEWQIRELTAALIVFRRTVASAERAGWLSPQDAAADADKIRSVQATLTAAWRAWIRASAMVR
jgi:hypothetical protein